MDTQSLISYMSPIRKCTVREEQETWQGHWAKVTAVPLYGRWSILLPSVESESLWSEVPGTSSSLSSRRSTHSVPALAEPHVVSAASRSFTHPSETPAQYFSL